MRKQMKQLSEDRFRWWYIPFLIVDAIFCIWILVNL